MVEVTCIDEVNGQFFLVTTLGGITVRTPITEQLATILLALGVPRCS
ncbi:DUF3956 family protein [Brevibacillus laterosporus]|nr:DUF3956 family protein [Brevibacillus laterosporus]MDN9011202.1 DUF3956 family protein [Brevibacillus laterosporus]MDO0942225.1 DUF3956 family protein [Brevibacillus laterosporus]